MVNWFGPRKYHFAAKSNAPLSYVRYEQIWYNRRNLYKNFLCVRHVIQKEKQLQKFEDHVANGTVFIPDCRQPPWRKINNPELDRIQGEKVNFNGFRVRLAKPQNAPEGFPTHYQ